MLGREGGCEVKADVIRDRLVVLGGREAGR